MHAHQIDQNQHSINQNIRIIELSWFPTKLLQGQIQGRVIGLDSTPCLGSQNDVLTSKHAKITPFL